MKILLFAAVLLLAATYPAAAQTVLQFALPTPETHPRNQALVRWADAVATKSEGQLLIAILHGATDYPGSRIPAAVAEGVYDLGASGWWHLSRYAPDFAVASLPIFYGRDVDPIHEAYDGALGQELKNRLEEALRIRVIGRSLDLGFGQIYSAAKPIKVYEDLQGLNFRVPGGGAISRAIWHSTPRRDGLPSGIWLMRYGANSSAGCWRRITSLPMLRCGKLAFVMPSSTIRFSTTTRRS